jgi:hypothetical protein
MLCVHLPPLMEEMWRIAIVAAAAVPAELHQAKVQEEKAQKFNC